MKLFAGTSNQSLVEKVAGILGIGLARYEFLKFDDGEIKPVVKESVRGEECVIVQSTSLHPNDYWMELFLLADALRRGAAKRIIAVIPCFGYARQNQMHAVGEPVTAHVLVNFMQTVGISEVLTFDLHDETMTGMFSIPITNASALPLLAETVMPYLGRDYAVVTPDQGGIERARLFAQSMGCNNPIVAIEKKRDLVHAHQSHAVQVLGDVKNLTVVIQDDVITSGGTILHAIDALAAVGAGDIYVCVTHQDFSPEVAERLQRSRLKKMFITNTVRTVQARVFEKLQIVDVSKLLADEIRKVAG